MFHTFYLAHTIDLKKIVQVHAYRPYAIHWGDLYLLDIPTTKFLHLGAPRNTTQAEFSGFEGHPIY